MHAAGLVYRAICNIAASVCDLIKYLADFCNPGDNIAGFSVVTSKSRRYNSPMQILVEKPDLW
jgi:hypothetical protein